MNLNFIYHATKNFYLVSYAKSFLQSQQTVILLFYVVIDGLLNLWKKRDQILVVIPSSKRNLCLELLMKRTLTHSTILECEKPSCSVALVFQNLIVRLSGE